MSLCENDLKLLDRKMLWLGLSALMAAIVLLLLISGTSQAIDVPVTEPIQNIDSGVYYSDIQAAVDAAASGDTLVITDYVFAGDLVVDGKDINIVDSSFQIDGNLAVRNGASLYIDPTWLNVTGNVYVDAATLTWDNTIVQVNATSNGGLEIWVNNTGNLYIINNSVVRSGTAFSYMMFVEGEIQVVDSAMEDMRTIRMMTLAPASTFENATISDWEWYGFWVVNTCLLYTSPSPRDLSTSRMPSSA